MIQSGSVEVVIRLSGSMKALGQSFDSISASFRQWEAIRREQRRERHLQRCARNRQRRRKAGR